MSKILRNGYQLSWIFLFPILFLLLIPYYRFQLNPDGVANMAIAELLFNGNVNNAVNAYWGVLFPALIAFGKLFSGDFLLAAKSANAICAVWVLYQSHLIILKLIPSKFTRFCVLLALVSILLKNALLIITADLLFLAIALNILYLLAFKDGKKKFT